MEQKALRIFRSSAGSGKTFTLVKEYLRICLPQPERFRNVVAITFTNAAAAEMKDRILQKLKEMTEGTETVMSRQLLKEGLTEQDLKNAPRLLENILFQYDHFHVSTIDSFFNKILRAFNRELDLPAGFEIFLKTDEALNYAVDNFIHRSQMYPEQHKVLLSFLREKIIGGSSWVLRPDIHRMAQELVKDSELLMQQVELGEVQAFIESLQQIMKAFEDYMHKLGDGVLAQLTELGLQVEDFKYGASGPAGHFHKIRKEKKDYAPGTRFRKALESETEWYKKGDASQRLIEEALATFLLEKAQEVHEHFMEHHSRYIAASELLRNIYTFAVFEEISELLQEYRTQNNIVLVSDQAKILAKHLVSEDISFVYSKIGTKLEHFLIDEFQDTSGLQWLSLKPLVENAIAQGAACLVVGDSKQAIYRWRGGEVQLIEQQLTERDFPEHSAKLELDTNYRSKRNIIEFNNSFFAEVPSLYSNNEGFELMQQIFASAAQKSPEGSAPGGYVQIDFFSRESRKEDFREKARAQLLKNIEEALQDGYRKCDICLLVRKTSEAKDLAKVLAAEQIDFITQDSLYLDHSPQVRLLLSLLGLMNDPENALAATQAAFLYRKYILQQANEEIDIQEWYESPAKAAQLVQKWLPEELTAAWQQISTRPLYELTEEMVRLLGLHRQPDVYLQRFLDAVFEYTQEENLGLKAFLEWWENNRFSVVLPEGQDAIQIMTIHKSKGLEFPVVMMPFAKWEFSTGSDILWVQSEEEPFNRFRFLPVQSVSRLKESLFAPAWQMEESMTAIDNLNLLYVGFTRARERLYVSTQIERPAQEGNYRDIAQVITTALLENSEKDDRVFTSGTRDKAEAKTGQTSSPAQEAPHFPVRQVGNELFYTPETDQIADILEGNEVFTYLQETGGGLFGEASPLASALKKLFKKHNLLQFYSGNGKSHSLPALLLPGGGSFKPHKVHEGNDKLDILYILRDKEKLQQTEKDLDTYKKYIAKRRSKEIAAWLLDLQNDRMLEIH